jgi:putative MATE family efflux protein
MRATARPPQITMHDTSSAATSAATGAAAPVDAFLSAVREALRGSERDHTTGPVGRSVLILAIPMVLEMAMESLFAVVDVFFVAHLGPVAAATVGLTESLMTLVYALAMGLSIGVTAMVSRRIGERDTEQASVTAAQAVWLGLLVAGALGAFGVVLAPRLLGVMGADAAVVASGGTYARIMLGGNATVLLLFLINAIFRGAGDAVLAMRVLWLANGINIVLDPCLILGLGPFPELGVTGAAVATNIGRGTGVLYALWHLLGGSGRARPGRRHFRLQPRLMWRLVRLSATGTVQVLIGMVSWIFLMRIMASFGSAAVAGYTIAIRVFIFGLLPSWGMSNAAATMVGQALGAGVPDRARAAVRYAGVFNAAFLAVIGLVFVVATPAVIGVFTADPAVLAYGVDALRIVATGFVFYGWGMVLTQALNGAGDTWTPTWINLVCFWLVQVPLAWLLALRGGLGPRGVFVAIVVAEVLLTMMSWWVYRRGRWALRTV